MKNKLLLLATMLGILFVLGLDTGGFQQILLKIAEEYNLSYAMMSSLVTAKCIANFACLLLFGPLSDRVGKKKILLCATALFSAGSLLAGVAHSFPITFLSIVFIGMAFGICESLSTAVLADAFPMKREQILIFSQAFFSAGAVVGPWIITNLMEYVWRDWRIDFFVLMMLMLSLSFLLSVLYIPKYEEKSDKEYAQEIINVNRMQIYVLLLLLFVMFIYAGTENGLGYFIDTIFEKGYRVGELSTWALSGMWFAMLISRLLCAFFVKNQKKAVFFVLLLCAVLSSMLLFTAQEIMAVCICVLFGAAFGPVWPALMSFAVQEVPERSGTITSLMSAGNAIGAGLFPLIMGKAADLGNNTQYAVFVLLILTMISFFVFGIYSLMFARIFKKAK